MSDISLGKWQGDGSIVDDEADSCSSPPHEVSHSSDEEDTISFQLIQEPTQVFMFPTLRAAEAPAFLWGR